jgi:hypothetical protein
VFVWISLTLLALDSDKEYLCHNFNDIMLHSTNVQMINNKNNNKSMITIRKVSVLVWCAFLLLFLTTDRCASGFSSSSLPRLNGISGWRDANYRIDNNDDLVLLSDIASTAISTKRKLPTLLSHQVTLQGEKKYFQFHSRDELRIFQQAIDCNHGIFGLGFIIREEDGDDVMMNTMQLMEITEYNMNLGVDFGIFCTAQTVGRASVRTILDKNDPDTTTSPDIESSSTENRSVTVVCECEEQFDDHETYYTLEDANKMARDVVDLIGNVSAIEQGVSLRSLTNDDDNGVDYDNDNNDDDNDDEDDDCEESEETRQGRFHQAYRAAIDSDSQGYIYDSSSREGKPLLSWKQMNAISWAAFSSHSNLAIDETYRLHAMDMGTITNRLKLATYWLSDVLLDAEETSQLI